MSLQINLDTNALQSLQGPAQHTSRSDICFAGCGHLGRARNKGVGARRMRIIRLTVMPPLLLAGSSRSVCHVVRADPALSWLSITNLCSHDTPVSLQTLSGGLQGLFCTDGGFDNRRFKAWRSSSVPLHAASQHKPLGAVPAPVASAKQHRGRRQQQRGRWRQ